MSRAVFRCDGAGDKPPRYNPPTPRHSRKRDPSAAASSLPQAAYLAQWSGGCLPLVAGSAIGASSLAAERPIQWLRRCLPHRAGGRETSLGTGLVKAQPARLLIPLRTAMQVLMRLLSFPLWPERLRRRPIPVTDKKGDPRRQAPSENRLMVSLLCPWPSCSGHPGRAALHPRNAALLPYSFSRSAQENREKAFHTPKASPPFFMQPMTVYYETPESQISKAEFCKFFSRYAG